MAQESILQIKSQLASNVDNAPVAGQFMVFIDSSDGILKKKDSAGVVTYLSASDFNDKVKISATDTTEGYLLSKLIGTTNKVVLTKINAGANEQIVISLGTDVFDKSANNLDDISEGTTNKAFTSTEKTKLSGIEVGATADQTASEIEAAYNAQVAVVSQLDAEAGTSTSVWRWTVERVRQAIAAFAVQKNASITGATKTKVTYDAKGLVTSGADATTADIADSTDKRYVTDAQLTVIGNTSGTNSGNETVTTIGALINGATAKTTPVDADQIGLMDSAAGNVLKKVSWLNIKATLKTYFDTIYNTLQTQSHAECYFATTNTTDTVIAAANTPVKALGTTTFGFNGGSWGNGGVSNRLRWNGAATIRVKILATATILKTQGAGTDTYNGYIAQTAAVLVRSKSSIRGETVDLHNMTCTCIADIAPGQYFEFYIENRDSANDCQVESLHLSVVQILN